MISCGFDILKARRGDHQEMEGERIDDDPFRRKNNRPRKWLCSAWLKPGSYYIIRLAAVSFAQRRLFSLSLALSRSRCLSPSCLHPGACHQSSASRRADPCCSSSPSETPLSVATGKTSCQWKPWHLLAQDDLIVLSWNPSLTARLRSKWQPPADFLAKHSVPPPPATALCSVIGTQRTCPALFQRRNASPG